MVTLSLIVSENLTDEVEVIEWEHYCKRMNKCDQGESSEKIKDINVNVTDDT